MMRARRLQWVSAAACIQRAVRLWALRRKLVVSRQSRRRMLLAISRLQACWKCRKLRQHYLRLQASCTLLQVCLWNQCLSWEGRTGHKVVCRTTIILPSNTNCTIAQSCIDYIIIATNLADRKSVTKRTSCQASHCRAFEVVAN